MGGTDLLRGSEQHHGASRHERPRKDSRRAVHRGCRSRGHGTAHHLGRPFARSHFTYIFLQVTVSFATTDSEARPMMHMTPPRTYSLPANRLMVASRASAGHELAFKRPARSQEHAVVLSHEDSGRQEIDLSTYDIRRGRVLFVRPGQISTYKDCDTLDVTEIFYSPSLLDECTADTLRRIGSTPFIDIPASQWKLTLPCHEQILAEANARHPDWSMIRLLLSSLLYITARLHQDHHKAAVPRHYHARVARLQALIAKRCSIQERADDYARRLRISSKRLNEITRECLGKTVSQMVRDAVLTEAQRALAHSDESIKMISYRLGFDDPSYFSRFFRREAGETPSAFRRRMHSHSPCPVQLFHHTLNAVQS